VALVIAADEGVNAPDPGASGDLPAPEGEKGLVVLN